VHVVTGEFREVRAPEKLVYSWAWLEGDQRGNRSRRRRSRPCSAIRAAPMCAVRAWRLSRRESRRRWSRTRRIRRRSTRSTRSAILDAAYGIRDCLVGDRVTLADLMQAPIVFYVLMLDGIAGLRSVALA
jgi:glutathione S-transferase